MGMFSRGDGPPDLGSRDPGDDGSNTSTDVGSSGLRRTPGFIPVFTQRRQRPVVIPNRRGGSDSSGQSNPRDLNESAANSQPSKSQLLVAARDSMIPVLYGGPERMAGKLYTARIYQGKLVVCLLLCEGPIDSITDLEIDDKPLPASVTYAAYLGTDSQTADPTLVAAMAAQTPPVTYAETLANTAYIVVVVPPGVSQGFPRITCLVKGRKVYNPSQLFKAVKSDLNTSTWTNYGTAPGYVANSKPARDETITAHALLDLNATGGVGGRKFLWTVPNDSVLRSISISINKDVLAEHEPLVGIEYSGGTPTLFSVRLNLGTGAVTVVDVNAAGVVKVVDRPNHWEVIMRLANNSSGNTTFTLYLNPAYIGF